MKLVGKNSVLIILEAVLNTLLAVYSCEKFCGFREIILRSLVFKIFMHVFIWHLRVRPTE